MTHPVDHATIRAFLGDINEAAAQACKGINDPGLLQLSRLHPTETNLKPIRRFRLGDVDGMVEDAIANARAGYNVYIEPRTIRANAPKRGRGEDHTATVFALCIDRDSYSDKAGKPFAAPSICVETSPGSSHDWFLLDTAISYTEARELGAAIRSSVKADANTGNPAQPYRVAGTPNFPSPKKIETGRQTCATSYRNGGPIYSADELRKISGPLEARVSTHSVEEIATGYVPADIEALVATTEWPKDRSTAFAHAVRFAVERGMTFADFEALCRANPQGFSQKYLPPERPDELHKRIAEIWTLHAAEIAQKDVLGRAASAAVLSPDTPAKAASIVQVGEWVRKLNQASDPLIEDAGNGEIIGRGQQGVIYGPFGTGKTAVVNEMCRAISKGSGMGVQPLSSEPVFRSVKGRVLTAIYEDPIDYKRRMLALERAHGVSLDDLNWAVISADLDITRDRDRATLLQRIRDDAAVNGPPALLVVDTVAAAVGGKSVSDDDVAGQLYALSQTLVREFMCTTLFVAHPGKDETKGIAGSYRLSGNADFILKAISTKDGYRLLKEKDRGGAKRPLFDYSLSFIPVEQTASGKPRTGAIVGLMTPCEQESFPQHVASDAPLINRRLSPRHQLALEALTDALAEAGRPAPAGLELPAAVRVVDLIAWRSELYARRILDETVKNPRTEFTRIRESLVARKLIGHREEWVWLVSTAAVAA